MKNPDTLVSFQQELRSITERALSPRSRYLHVLLLLLSTTMGLLCISLLLTEPRLPMRAQVSFVVMSGIAVAWIVYAIWVLRNRRTLMAGQRIVAGRMAVAFSGIFLVASAGMLIVVGKPLHIVVAIMASGMLLAAIAILIRAHRHAAKLLSRRRELEGLLS